MLIRSNFTGYAHNFFTLILFPSGFHILSFFVEEFVIASDKENYHWYNVFWGGELDVYNQVYGHTF